VFSIWGIFFLLLAVALLFVSSKVRECPALRNSVILIVLARQLVTYLQITAGPLPTVDRDPIAFNDYAMRVGSEHLVGNSYAEFLRVLYDFLGGSHLLGCEVNQIGFSIALICFVELLYLLGHQACAPRLVLLFGLLPSVLLNSSVVLREGPQMAGFMALLVGLLNVRRHGIHQGTLIVPLAAVALIFLQNGFAPYLLLVLPLALIWATGSRPWLLVCAGAVALFVVPAFGGRILQKLSASSVVVREAVSGDGLAYVGEYQLRVNQGRSDFETKLDISSPYRLLRTGPVVGLQYLFAPFPWQVRGVIDLYGMFESGLRLLLFLFALRAVRRARGDERQELIFLLLMFLSMEAVWAAGTANWGTAFRHRVVAWGVLVALGGPGLLSPRGSKAEGSAPAPSLWKKESIRARRRRLRQRAPESRALGSHPHRPRLG
jgi:hypothetical protein